MDHIPVNATGKAPASAFTGDVYVTPLKPAEEPSRLIAALVRFTPGARTNWHSHAVGQTLYVTEGIGLVVSRDGQIIRARAGDTIWTRPGEEHWHGALNDTAMSHIAMLEGIEGIDGGDGGTWLEPVDDDAYRAANDH
jgi:quercetin dioxygenase-like cupin family protein